MPVAQFPLLCEVMIIAVGAEPDAVERSRFAEQSNPARRPTTTHVVSQVIPAEVPILKFIDRLRDSINDELSMRGEVPLPAANYELRTIGGTRLDGRCNLRELGVSTGLPLVLAPAEKGAPYVAQYEQLSTGLARFGKKLIKAVTTDIAAGTAMAVLALAVLGIIALGLRARTFTDAALPYIITGAVGALLAALALATSRWWPGQRVIIDSLAWMACATLTVFGYMFAPGHLGAPQLLLAGLAAVLSVSAAARFTGRHITAATAIVTVCVVASLSAALRLWRPVPGQWLGLITLVIVLVLVFVTERIALRACGIRPPNFGSITQRDIFARVKGLSIETVAAIDDSETDPTPTGEQIADSALRVADVMAGLLTGCALVLPAAIWVVVIPGAKNAWMAMLIAALFVLIFISRGRAFLAWRQAVPLVVGACVAALGVIVKYALHYPGGDTVVYAACSLAALAFALCGLAAATVVPHSRFFPPLRVFVEWLEIAAITVSIPLMGWMTGLYWWTWHR
jgi:type VII secretion integral membrane protein EccD